MKKILRLQDGEYAPCKAASDRYDGISRHLYVLMRAKIEGANLEAGKDWGKLQNFGENWVLLVGFTGYKFFLENIFFRKFFLLLHK